jgi:hypothetical protein
MNLIEPTSLGVENLKLLLICFENMSGLKINFSKSEAIVTGVTEPEKRRIADGLNCKLGLLPLHYLCLPVSDKRLSVADWNPAGAGVFIAFREILKNSLVYLCNPMLGSLEY